MGASESEGWVAGIVILFLIISTVGFWVCITLSPVGWNCTEYSVADQRCVKYEYTMKANKK